MSLYVDVVNYVSSKLPSCTIKDFDGYACVKFGSLTVYTIYDMGEIVALESPIMQMDVPNSFSLFLDSVNESVLDTSARRVESALTELKAFTKNYQNRNESKSLPSVGSLNVGSCVLDFSFGDSIWGFTISYTENAVDFAKAYSLVSGFIGLTAPSIFVKPTHLNGSEVFK